jgi:O-antigen/teichoic acid export membrane protein
VTPASIEPDRPLRVGSISLDGLPARLLRGFSWNLVGTIFTQGSTLAANVILARLWGVRVFGDYMMVQSTVTALTSVAQPATGATATKYVAELRTSDPARAGRVLGLCSLVTLAIALLAGAGLMAASSTVARDMLNDPALRAALVVAGAAVFFSVFCGFFNGVLAGLESYAVVGRAGVVAGILYIAICLGAGWTWGLIGAVWGVAVSAALQSIVLLLGLRAETARYGIRVSPRHAWHEASVLFRFVAPAVLNGLLVFPSIWLSNTFLAGQANGDVEMGLFGAANSFRILVLFLPNILGNVSMSLLNNQRGALSERGVRRVFWTNLIATAGIVLTGSWTLALSGRWLLGAFGLEFGAAYPVLLILMLSTLPETMAIAMLQLIQSRERVWLALWAIVLPCYAVLLGVAYWLTPHYGARGLAWSYAAGMSVACLAALAAVRRVGLWEARG